MPQNEGMKSIKLSPNVAAVPPVTFCDNFDFSNVS